jgi:hypothetical protein
MRSTRKIEESHFAKVFLSWFQKNHDPDAHEMPGITDCPDMAMETRGRILAVEFSQIPSSYIIQEFHRQMPAPLYAKDKITGNLVVYPFEPHRWVHEVIKNKEVKADAYKLAVRADEIWLVMHCHSMRDDWPMSGPSRLATRDIEALLMRFGLKATRGKFERVFYVYADGTVIDLTEGVIPSAIGLPKGYGYPAVTAHKFSFGFAVPLPGLGVHECVFDTIAFNKTVIVPKDDWMANTFPEIKEPVFTSRASVSSEIAEWEISRDGNVISRQRMEVSEHIGQTRYLHFLLEWSIEKTTFEVQF